MNLKLCALKIDTVDLYANHGQYHDGDSGLDLFTLEDIVVPPRSTVKLKFGIACSATIKKIARVRSNAGTFVIEENEVPTGYQLLPRSSISKTPLIMHNSTGLIDAAYRGEIMAPVYNLSDEPYTVVGGTRLFQIVGPALEPINMRVVFELSKTTRGAGGFGSTDVAIDAPVAGEKLATTAVVEETPVMEVAEAPPVEVDAVASEAPAVVKEEPVEKVDEQKEGGENTTLPETATEQPIIDGESTDTTLLDMVKAEHDKDQNSETTESLMQ